MTRSDSETSGQAGADLTKKTALLDAAASIVAGEGVSALSTRRLAAKTGGSTMGVYTWFGNKANLLRAIYREAFERFDRSQLAVPTTEEPLADLIALSWAYRDYALTNPHLYQVMWGHRLSLFEPTDEDLALAAKTFDVLVQAITRCVDAELLTCEPFLSALQLWAAQHGMVSLEILLGDVKDSGLRGPDNYAGLLRTMLIGFGAAPDLSTI